MAFSYDPDGGVAIARILSDHPEDNGRIVYLHRYVEPAIDDEWYDRPDEIPAALPPGNTLPSISNSNSNTHSGAGFDEKKQGSGTTQITRKRPQTIPVGQSAGHTTFTTAETPDTEFPFPASTSASDSSHSGRSLLRGGAFGDETDEKDRHQQGSTTEVSRRASDAADSTVAQLGILSGAGSSSAASLPKPSSLKRSRYQTIHFDPLPSKDEKGNAVEPRRKTRQRQRKESPNPGYPLPAKDPETMTEAEFDLWAQSLTDKQWEAFCDHMEDMEQEEESDDDEENDNESEEEVKERPFKRAKSTTTGWKDMMPASPPASLLMPPPLVRPPRPPPVATHPAAGSSSSTLSPLDMLGADYFQRGSRERHSIKEKDLKVMAAQLAYGAHHVPNYQGPKAATMRKIHDEAVQASERRQMGKEIELFGGDCFRLIPSWPKRECIFIVGQQGAGKSWFAGRYIREWKKQHPDGKVPDDKELDKCGITRVMIDDGLVDNPYEIKELNNCLVLFDDIDAIRDKKIKKAVTDLCDELQVIGRHENTWVLRTSHLFRNWGTTRASLAESNKTVFFPQLGSSYGIKSWLKTHVGLDPKKIERMFKLRSRWVVLDQHAPNWVLSEHLLYIL